ncbi:MAG TPA: lytic transglycosylase domain-containing protein [Xanthomonadaceae bacterium]|nr:lytic transglycosylase domain-containing protein [Xanthomonadaceae bacterium]
MSSCPARVACALLLIATPVAAGELYRCNGPGGSTAYTSSSEGYQGCKLIDRFADAPAPAPAAAGSAPARTVEFRTGRGDAAPSAPPAARTAKVTRGAVYRYENDGVVHYTNRKPARGNVKVLFSYIETCYACAALPGLDWNAVALNTAAFTREISDSARAHGVEEALVRAIIHAESAFKANAVSRVGAQGLMQLMPDTARRFGVADSFAAAQNIGGGTQYLAWLLKRYGGDTRLAAAAYNAGEGAVDKYAGVPPYEETQRFVERVGILHQRYQTATPVSVAAGSP